MKQAQAAWLLPLAEEDSPPQERTIPTNGRDTTARLRVVSKYALRENIRATHTLGIPLLYEETSQMPGAHSLLLGMFLQMRCKKFLQSIQLAVSGLVWCCFL